MIVLSFVAAGHRMRVDGGMVSRHALEACWQMPAQKKFPNPYPEGLQWQIDTIGMAT
jgi:hypothetical protein